MTGPPHNNPTWEGTTSADNCPIRYMDYSEQTDTSMIEAIHRGDAEAWAQLVDEYEGRLLRFAMARVPQRADAEDIVQETFAAFVKIGKTLQIKTSIETYLFGILRHEIVNRVRTRWARTVCLIQDIYHTGTDGVPTNPLACLPASDTNVSQHISHNEQHELQRQALAGALNHFVRDLQAKHKLRDLKAAELLFYCHLPNRDAARLLGLKEQQTRAVKHRCLKRIRGYVNRDRSLTDLSVAFSEDMLTEIWETERPTCPKRSTLGAFLLETLAPEWFDYVDFHLTTMGCHFCRASFKDLQEQQSNEQSTQFQQRILNSTVGFLTRM